MKNIFQILGVLRTMNPLPSSRQLLSQPLYQVRQVQIKVDGENARQIEPWNSIMLWLVSTSRPRGFLLTEMMRS